MQHACRTNIAIQCFYFSLFFRTWIELHNYLLVLAVAAPGPFLCDCEDFFDSVVFLIPTVNLGLQGGKCEFSFPFSRWFVHIFLHAWRKNGHFFTQKEPAWQFERILSDLKNHDEIGPYAFLARTLLLVILTCPHRSCTVYVLYYNCTHSWCLKSTVIFSSWPIQYLYFLVFFQEPVILYVHSFRLFPEGRQIFLCLFQVFMK